MVLGQHDRAEIAGGATDRQRAVRRRRLLLDASETQGRRRRRQSRGLIGTERDRAGAGGVSRAKLSAPAALTRPMNAPVADSATAICEPVPNGSEDSWVNTGLASDMSARHASTPRPDRAPRATARRTADRGVTPEQLEVRSGASSARADPRRAADVHPGEAVVGQDRDREAHSRTHSAVEALRDRHLARDAADRHRVVDAVEIGEAVAGSS